MPILRRFQSRVKFFKASEYMQPKAEVQNLKHMRTSHLVEPNLVGKHTLHACKRLVERILTHKEEKAYKVGIVGTGGVGKTTLAQKIYNAENLKGAFSNQAWICVSRDYSDITLLKELLRNFGVHHEQGETLGELSSKLAAVVWGKSFFRVLDDVWEPEVWTNVLRTPLHAAAAGVILVTTRHDAVAHATGVEDPHQVDSMSAEVGWELLWKSMNISDERDVEDLRNIGLDIIRKCGGLPLAIKVTARVLATKDKTDNAWRKFINRSAWSVGNLPTELRGALYLSYDDLPHHLKQCFLYCALYPEDSTMSRDDLVMLWVAEGFIEEQHGQLLEETAEEYYYELIHRNLLQPDGIYFDHMRCKMHDLLRQLACYLSREECFIGDPESLGPTNMSKMRRLTVVTKKGILVLPSMANGEARARTFQTDQQPRRVEDTFFMRFPYLRILELSDSLLQSIPDYIGKLIHLRLLDLDGTCISCLPESISSLINLQILNLQRCQDLHGLPLAITRLSNLRRLGLAGTPINQVPEGIGRLKYLNDLGGFPVGGVSDDAKTQDGWKLEELEHLSHLRRLDLIKLERAALHTTGSVLADKRYLHVLNLSCTDRTDVPYSEEDVSNTEKILEQLVPPQNLEDLLINGFFGRRYPTWLGTTHLSSLKHLKLVDCKICVYLPPIGQLANLKYLKIDGATKITKIGPEFVGCRGARANPRSMVSVAFPKLEVLVIRDLHNWEDWSFIEDAAGAAATEGGGDIDAEM
uniref:Uncharacterized protein n=2 Tax=Aegilops tauschii subsp. strangulata TaxID=200361 RepID=A0A453DYM2_AEGTS